MRRLRAGTRAIASANHKGGHMTNMPGYPYQGYGPNVPMAAPRNGMGIAALILGIIGLLTFWTVFGGILLGLLALIFGILGFRRTRRGEATNSGVSVTGIVLGSLALVASVVVLIAGVSLLHSQKFQNYQDCIDHASTASQRQDCVDQFRHSVSGD
jgi:hypothetical protein